MIKNVDFLIDIYKEIKAKALQKSVAGTTTVLILCHVDLDSICSLKILATLMKQDLIAHEIIPIATYKNLGDCNEKMKSMLSVVMINVGGLVNIEEFFEIDPMTTIYLLDSNRPLNLFNLFGDIVCIDNEMTNVQELREAFEQIQFEGDSEVSSDEDEKEDEQNEYDVEEEENRSLKDDSDEEAEESEINNEDDKEERKFSRKRKRIEEIKQRKRRVKEYYQETFNSTPICVLIYELCLQLGKENMDFLWYKIVSITNNLQYGKLSLVDYTNLASKSTTELHRLGGASGEDKISVIDDLQLMLLRHWNLYDAMYHSTYVATKLGIWKQRGRQNLNNLLVKMGFPTSQSTQYFKEMDTDFKSQLPQKLSDFGLRFNMKDIIFPSFERQFGFNTTVSCTDVVYAINALFDCGLSFIDDKGLYEYEKLLYNHPDNDIYQEYQVHDDSGLIGAGIGTKTTTGTIATTIRDHLKKYDSDCREDWNRHFYLAYDSLSNSSIIDHGIVLAIYLQKIMVKTAIAILEKKLVQTLGAFQLAILKHDEEGIGKSIPLLYRLVQFLMSAFAEYKRKMALVLVAPSGNEYIVMGRAAELKNGFGVAFVEAAKASECRVEFDFIDANVVKVAKEDLTAFLENLQFQL